MAENRDLLDRHIKRTVARAALMRIHRMIEEDAADDRSAVRFAGIATGVVLGAVFAVVVAMTVAHAFRNGHAVAPTVSNLIVLAVLTLLAVLAFGFAHYFRRVYPGPFRAHGGRTLSIAALAAVVLVAIFAFTGPIHGCAVTGDPTFGDGAEAAVSELSLCLAYPTLTPAAREATLRKRARANNAAGNDAAALADVEEAFRLSPPTKTVDFIDHAIYLRGVGRLDESLRALDEAERVGTAETRASIDYQRGVTLAALDRHEEAIELFTRTLGKPTPWALHARGLSYERTGQTARARADYRGAARLLRQKIALTASERALLDDAEARAERLKMGEREKQ